ncbi:MAG TPA: response regulator transcription factor [Flavobacteriaceae bacterium]|nr:response regulator transcription factor [Flavobacteriaceae bacterium]
MNVVIVEDEINAQEALANILGLINKSIKIKGFAKNVPDAIALVNKAKPDVVFLDIHLKNGTGFDVLEGLDNFTGKIVFTTAYENYAIKAFKFSAFDYILKPINPQELATTINELSKEVKKDVKYQEMLSVLKGNREKNSEPQIVLKTINNQYVINVKDIIRCESEGAYTKFFFKNKTHLTSRNLKYYTEILMEYGFIRTHQSHLVNSRYILRINSKNFVELKDLTQIPISARKKTEVNKQMKALNL